MIYQAVIVEDEPSLATIFSMTLQMAGYETVTFHDGQQALNYLGQSTPHLLVLDLHLPKVSGENLLQYARSQIHLSQTKIIVVTADGVMANAVREASDLVLMKPVAIQQLRQMSRRFAPSGIV